MSEHHHHDHLGLEPGQRVRGTALLAIVTAALMIWKSLMVYTRSESPVVVRVLATWQHGAHLRYDLEWAGFAPGKYDIAKFLVRKDGSSADNVAPIEVEVLSMLPFDAFEPSELELAPAARLDGYTTTQILLGVFWGVGLLAILFVGRKWRRKS